TLFRSQEIHLSVISLSGSVDEDDGSLIIFWR
ncbi:MAG TPA: monooxygenase, partial [Brevundimonas sp.]|nr:monooxygenase [Brevundimonas sp.]